LQRSAEADAGRAHHAVLDVQGEADATLEMSSKRRLLILWKPVMEDSGSGMRTARISSSLRRTLCR
jgi:hypothetical protein